jgi:hypothetical protein
MKLPARICKECGEKIDLKKGRVDRLFCDYECKNRYHNKQSYEEKIETARIKKILSKNRNILKKMALRKDSDEISKDILLKAGFDFDFHTHFRNTKHGNYQYTFCFDYGYRKANEGYGKKDRYKVVKAFAEKEV